MSGVLYEEHSVISFLFVSVVLGGGAAWLTGRAIATIWRPWWMIVPAVLGLGLLVRFFHFALFDATLLSLQYYAVDTTIGAVCAILGYRVTRSRQMVQQYGFLQRN